MRAENRVGSGAESGKKWDHERLLTELADQIALSLKKHGVKLSLVIRVHRNPETLVLRLRARTLLSNAEVLVITTQDPPDSYSSSSSSGMEVLMAPMRHCRIRALVVAALRPLFFLNSFSRSWARVETLR